MPTVMDEYYIEEFWRQSGRVSPDKCWEWRGKIRPDGYGSYTPIRYQGRKIQKAPNIAYLIVYGGLPKGAYICHKCDNKKCVNPNHLYAGTSQDNVIDMHDRGRYRGGIRL